jgi:hypothetical protein
MIVLSPGALHILAAILAVFVMLTAVSVAAREGEAASGVGAASGEEASSGMETPAGAEATSDTRPFDVYAGLDRRSIAVGDTFRLNLDLSWQDGVEVKPLAVGDKLGPFTVRDLQYGIASPRDGGFSRRVSVLLTVFETGEQNLPAVPIVFIDQSGTARTVKTPPLSIEVISVLPEDAAEPRDIKAPISVPKRWKDMILSYALLIGLVAGAATSVMLSVMRREQIEAFFLKLYARIATPLRRLILMLLAALGLIHRQREQVFDVEVTEPDLDPEVAALRELDRIDALGLLAREMIKEHYTLVSESLRRYLERKFNVLAMESPTSLTLRDLGEKRIDPDGLRLTGEVLAEGDLVKFAKFIPGPEPAGSLTARARNIVGLTRTTGPARTTGPTEMTEAARGAETRQPAVTPERPERGEG